VTFRLNDLRSLLLRAAFLAACSLAYAQSPPTITGIVTDPSGALVPNATVTLHPTKSGKDISSATTPTGGYSLSGQPRTQYQLIVTAPGFATFVSNSLQLTPGKPRTLDIRLKIADEAVQITVNDDSTAIDTDPNHNGDSLNISGKALEALPVDPNELMQQLQGLSGGPNPDIHVDGFSGGTVPPLDTIREIRINQNPYSAQNDTTPGNGLIEIFTKPGANHLHGTLIAYGNTNSFNTTNPFAGPQPPYYAFAGYGNINGPLGKHASFFVNGGENLEHINTFIDAQDLDSNNQVASVTQAISAPTNAYNVSNRLDYALGKKSTIIARYNLSQSDQTNAGAGQLALTSQGYDNHNTNQLLQLSNSQILTAKIVNDTRFQYTRSRVSQIPFSSSPTISVAGAFTGGGSNGGSYNDNQDRFELQNYVSAAAGKHFLTFGGRFRSTRDANRSTANYNGTYTFASLTLAPVPTPLPTPIPSCTVLTPLTTCNSYQVTEQKIAALQSGHTYETDYMAIQQAGGGPSQFSITQGNPNVVVSVADLGLFLQDDWKARPDLTLSGGLRFETQNHIADHADWAPRFGFAWNPTRKPPATGKADAKPKPANYTIRGAAGIFYHRFTSGYVLQAQRQNGVTQQQYIVPDPQFFFPTANPSNLSTYLAGNQSQSTIYQISPTFHAPYYLSSTVSVERRIGTHGSVTASWVGIRGDHTQLIRNANAPLPGTYNSAIPSSGTRPLGTTQNIYEYDSEGVAHTNRFSSYGNLRFFNGKLFLYASYQLQAQNADASDAAFVSNSYNIGADFGRAANDIRHQAWISASATLPFNLSAYTFSQVRSGTPFNIVVGQDLNGDSIFNDRPAFATDLTRASVVHTAYGTFDTSPIAGQTIIPINYGHGPGFFTVNAGINRAFHFGPELKPAPGTPAPTLAPGQKPTVVRRCSLVVGVDIQNLFNQVNLAPPIGTLNSPLFGKSIAIASGNGATNANRIVELEAIFRF